MIFIATTTLAGVLLLAHCLDRSSLLPAVEPQPLAWPQSLAAALAIALTGRWLLHVLITVN